jgi:hypothetical protein
MQRRSASFELPSNRTGRDLSHGAQCLSRIKAVALAAPALHPFIWIDVSLAPPSKQFPHHVIHGKESTVVINVDVFDVFKRLFEKNGAISHEETSLTRNLSSNRQFTYWCTNSPFVLSIQCCTNIFTSVFSNRLYL